jgi:hypothetical protein
MVSPSSVSGGNLQAIPYVLFDTQTLTSGTSTQLNYFQAVQADQTLGNMNAGGQLPVDTWLEIEWMFITPIIPTIDDAVPDVWDDMDQLMHTGRPTHTLTIQDKDYGQLPASFFHAEGGITGYGYNVAAVAATAVEYANWGRGIGFWVGGQIILPPQAGFNTRLRWNTAPTLPSGTNPLIRVSYLGTLHRPIL